MYKYRAIVSRVVDGDTIDLDIDLGFSVWLNSERIRLEGIDTPEIRTKDKEEKKYGRMAKEFVEDKLPVGAKVTVMTKIDKEGKFGRMLGHIFCVNEKKWDISINSQLVYNNLAVRYNGQSKNDIKAAHRANWAALELKEI